MTDFDPNTALVRMAVALEAAGIPYMVTGSVAGVLHGFPRATQDIDIVVDPTAETLQRFLSTIRDDQAYVSGEAAREALRRRGMFNIIELQSGWKIDLMIRKDRPFSRQEFGRAVYLTAGGHEIRVVSAEDLILAKLELARDGGSGRQIEDAASIARVLQDELDRKYLARWVVELGVADAWNAVRPAGWAG